VAVGTGILFGLVPRLSARSPNDRSAEEGGRGSTGGAHHNRLRNALIVAETVLALVLLIGAGLLVKSFVRLQNVSPGFNPHNVLTAEILCQSKNIRVVCRSLIFTRSGASDQKHSGRPACRVYSGVAFKRIEYGQLIHHRRPGSKK